MLTALLLALVAAVASPSTAPPSVQAFSDDDIARLVGAMYLFAEKKPAELRACVQHSNAPHEASGASMQDAVFNDQDAELLCTAASGEAGARWKALYESATDKVVLAKAIDGAIQASSKRESDAAHAQVSWMHASLQVGMKRSQVYGLLKSRNLVAYNEAYNPGKPFGTNSCDGEATKSLAYWPRYGEPLPARSGVCAMEKPAYVPNPDAFVELQSGHNIACGARIIVTLKFGLDDRLTSVTEDKESWTCV